MPTSLQSLLSLVVSCRVGVSSRWWTAVHYPPHPPPFYSRVQAQQQHSFKFNLESLKSQPHSPPPPLLTLRPANAKLQARVRLLWLRAPRPPNRPSVARFPAGTHPRRFPSSSFCFSSSSPCLYKRLQCMRACVREYDGDSDDTVCTSVPTVGPSHRPTHRFV